MIRLMRGAWRSSSPAARRRGRGFSAPWIDELEPRIQLTGNIAITNALLVNSNDQALSTINSGQQVYLQANFTTLNLPSNASYRVQYNINGQIAHTGYITFGAGSSGTGSWYWYLGSFVASLGTNQVTVTVDSDQSVAETSYTDNARSFSFTAVAPTAGYLTYSVSQIRAAYGINSIPNFGSAAADGTGQTIAIIDAYNDPSILTDLDGFDQSMDLSGNSGPTLYQQYGSASSILNVYNQSGTNITANIATSGSNGVPSLDSSGSWEGEETMDVEWAHAIAPGAHIDLIECNGGSNFDGLFIGAAAGAQLPGVTAESMSWSWTEGNWGNSSAELGYDAGTFQTPAGHPGVTFLASTGDGGAPGGYPSMSPNVVAVSASELTVNNGGYGSETAWSFPAPRTINNGSSAYLQTGAWASNSGGFSGTFGSATSGSSSSATWTTVITSADEGWVGGVEASATWVANAANATNALYKIYDGTPLVGNLLGSVTIDQTKSPVGTADGGSNFQELGDYFPSSGHLTVVLSSSSANGTVVADAIGIAPGWATGGGKSKYESEPSYQLPFQSTGARTIPDVSFDGSDNSGVTCYQNGGIGYDYCGTSLSSPCWAGLIAIANQGRVAAGGTPFNSSSNPTQVLQALYSLPSSDYHDITTGYAGLSPTVGYDQVTGRGTPIANLLIPDLVNFQLPPAALSSSFNYSVAVPSVTLTFSKDVSASLTASDLVLQNLTTGQTIPTSSITLVYNSSQNIATFTFPGYTHGILPDGNYQITIAATSVTDSSGNPMSGNFTFNFFVLAADANHDRTVNALDFNALADNYGKAATFSQGDFDYSGTVGSNDFAMLASRYGLTLGPAASSPIAEQMPAANPATSLSATASNLFADQPIHDEDSLLPDG